MPLDPSLFFRGAELQMANDQMNRQTMDKFFTTLAQSRQAQMPDIEKEAMAGLYTIEAGGVPTPKQQASLKVWQKLRQSEQMFDPATQSVIPKYDMSVFGVVPGELPTQQGYQSLINPEILNSPAMTMQTGQNMPVVNDLGGELLPPVGDNYDQVSGMTPDQRNAARGIPMPSNPKQAQTAYEANVDIAKEGEKLKQQTLIEGERAYASEKGTAAAKAESKLPAVKGLISNLEAFGEEKVKKLPGGLVGSLAAQATNLANAPNEAAKIQAEFDTMFPLLLADAKNIVRTSGEGTFTDQDAQDLKAMVFKDTDSNDVKVRKYKSLLEIMKRAEARIAEGSRTVKQGFKYLGTE